MMAHNTYNIIISQKGPDSIISHNEDIKYYDLESIVSHVFVAKCVVMQLEWTCLHATFMPIMVQSFVNGKHSISFGRAENLSHTAQILPNQLVDALGKHNE